MPGPVPPHGLGESGAQPRRSLLSLVGWWALAAALPVGCCASRLGLDLSYDEAFTLQQFVSHPVSQIVIDYSAPNNHILYSVLQRPVWLLSQEDWVLRLPSLLCTIGTLALVFRIGLRLCGLPTAVLATAFLGLNQVFLNHAMLVRGYPLSMFLVAWLADLATVNRPSSWTRYTKIGLIGAAAIDVIPTNVLFLVPLGALSVTWAGLRSRRITAAFVEAGIWLAALLLGALLYVPLYHWLRLAAGDLTISFWPNVAAMVADFFGPAMRDAVPLLPLLLLGAISYMLRRNRRLAQETLLVSALVMAGAIVPFVIAGLLRISPFPRSFCPALPILALLTGRLLAELIDTVRSLSARPWPEWIVPAGGWLLLVAVVMPRIVSYPQRLSQVRRQGLTGDAYFYYALADYRPSQVVAYLRQTIAPEEHYLICYDRSGYFVFPHYFARAGFDTRRPHQRTDGERRTVYCIVPSVAHFEDIETLWKNWGLTADQVRTFPVVREFDFYRILRSDHPVEIKVPVPRWQQPQTPPGHGSSAR